MVNSISSIVRLDKPKKRGLIFFVIFIFISVVSVLWKIAIIRSNASKNISTLQNEYEKYGFPVFASKIVHTKVNFFASISIEKSGDDFIAIVDRDMRDKVYLGSLVVLRRNQKDFVKGYVSHLSKFLDLDSGGYKVTIKFNSSIMLDNSFETALISVLSKNTIAVNNDNIGIDENGSFVWVIKYDVLHKQYIKTGVGDGFKTEIRSGLKVGDIIVTSDFKQIKENMKARVVDNLLK